MDTSPLVLEPELVETLRRRRAQLRESMDALEQALAAPPSGGPERWVQRVHVALVELSGDLREHVAITEGPDGLHRELAVTAPRLAGAVARLGEEHAVIRQVLDDLVTLAGGPEAQQRADAIREAGTDLLGKLVRHRQRGADLVFEAYEFDIGGET